MMVIIPLAVNECTPADFGMAPPTEEVTDPGDALPSDMLPGDVIPGDELPDLLPIAEVEAGGPAPKPLQMYPPNPVATTSLWVPTTISIAPDAKLMTVPDTVIAEPPGTRV